MRLTDMADELYTAAADRPGGVRAATAKRGGVTVTRVEIAREGLEKPRGRYVTLEVPSVSVLDERDAEVIEQAADELRALVPPEGPVLVLGVGNRRVTADALGPRTVQKIFVTMGAGRPPVKGIRPVAAVADHDEVRDVRRVEVLSDKTISMRMLFDAGHSLEERILSEQFGY